MAEPTNQEQLARLVGIARQQAERTRTNAAAGTDDVIPAVGDWRTVVEISPRTEFTDIRLEEMERARCEGRERAYKGIAE